MLRQEEEHFLQVSFLCIFTSENTVGARNPVNNLPSRFGDCFSVNGSVEHISNHKTNRSTGNKKYLLFGNVANKIESMANIETFLLKIKKI